MDKVGKNLIQILSRFYPDFIQILSRFYPDFLETQFIQIRDKIWIKGQALYLQTKLPLNPKGSELPLSNIYVQGA